MAVIVRNDPELDMPQADFHIGGVAALTLCINATLTPFVLKKAGLMKISAQRRELISRVETHIVNCTQEFLAKKMANQKQHNCMFFDANADLPFSDEYSDIN